MAALAQLGKHSTGRFGMQKRNTCVVSATARFLIYHPDPLFRKLCNGYFNILNFVCNMVDSLTIFFNKPGYRTIFGCRFQQFYFRFTNLQHGHTNLLFFYSLNPCKRHAQVIAVERKGYLQRFNSYTDMIDFGQHNKPF